MGRREQIDAPAAQHFYIQIYGNEQRQDWEPVLPLSLYAQDGFYISIPRTDPR